MKGFGERLAEASARCGAAAVVGLDPHLGRLPLVLRRTIQPGDRASAAAAVRRFNYTVIDAIRGVVPAVKPQAAFYEALGSPGWAVLEDTCRRAREAGLLVVMDAKRGDIGSTASAYGRALLAPDGPMGADALTVNPWMGTDTLDAYMPWVRADGRGLFVLTRTTNPGSAELQLHGAPPAAWKLAERIEALNRGLALGDPGPVGAVVGALSPDDARALRGVMPSAWFLVPGVGAQGGELEEALAGARSDGLGAAVTSSRAILFGPEAELPDGTLVDVGAAVGERARLLVQGMKAAPAEVTPGLPATKVPNGPYMPPVKNW